MSEYKECTYTGGNEPCPSCPRKITALYMCGILQDEARIQGSRLEQKLLNANNKPIKLLTGE